MLFFPLRLIQYGCRCLIAWTTLTDDGSFATKKGVSKSILTLTYFDLYLTNKTSDKFDPVDINFFPLWSKKQFDILFNIIHAFWDFDAERYGHLKKNVLYKIYSFGIITLDFFDVLDVRNNKIKGDGHKLTPWARSWKELCNLDPLELQTDFAKLLKIGLFCHID